MRARLQPTATLLAGIVAVTGNAAAGDLPYQSRAEHVGVATCATSVCHGSVTASASHNVRLDEFVTWSHRDKHSQAFTALSSEKGRSIAARLGIANARTEKSCLDCHSDNVAAQQRAAGFTLADGVTCEACHGGAGPWLVSHAAREATYRSNVERGMYPTADLPQRLELCLSCHYGNADKFVSHRIMGAGHPRLSFELDTFLALEPAHFEQDGDYRERKPTYTRVQVWAYGQLATARRQADLLQGALVLRRSFVPELALLDCHACHDNPLHRQDWRRGPMTRLSQPGALTFPKGHLEMALIITRHVAPAVSQELLAQSQRLQAAAGDERERVASVAADLGRTLERALADARSHRWTGSDAIEMLTEVVAAGSAGEYRDYISAEQVVMAVDVLTFDAGIADRYRESRDALFRAVRDEDAFRPAELRDILAGLDAALREQLERPNRQ